MCTPMYFSKGRIRLVGTLEEVFSGNETNAILYATKLVEINKDKVG